MRRDRIRLLLTLIAVGLALVFVTAAAAALQQYGSGTLGPGGYFQTPGWNNRDYNRSCRDGNSGKMSVAYYNTAGDRLHYSGVIWTNCPDIVARLENNGYFRCRCTHEGTVAFPVICQTFNI